MCCASYTVAMQNCAAGRFRSTAGALRAASSARANWLWERCWLQSRACSPARMIVLSRCAICSPTAAAVGEQIAQRLNTIIRAGEQARDCNQQRSQSQFARALDAARKAPAVERNLPAAQFCIATVYEAQHMGVDSQLAAYQRAAKGDSLNATAWENIAHLYQQKGDTLKAIDALTHELAGEPQNVQLRLGIAELLRQQKQYARAKVILDEWLAKNPSDP